MPPAQWGAMWRLALLGALLAPCGSARAVQRATADLDGDGVAEVASLDAAREPSLEITRAGKVVARAIPKRWKPWKLILADADGDGRMEIAVGVFKSTRFLPRPHNCLFLYTLRANRVEPVWLGSSLSRPFTDFIFAPPVAGRSWILYAMERRRDGHESLAEYRWNGFGFTLERRTGKWKSARIVSANRQSVKVRTGWRITAVARVEAVRNRSEGRVMR